MLSGCADDGEGGRHLIELSVRLDGVQHILVKLFFRYCAVGAQEGQQVLQEALRGVLRDGKLCGSEINQIGQFYYEADEELCEDCGKPVYAYYIEGFTLNGSMPGDEAIIAQVQEITDSM